MGTTFLQALEDRKRKRDAERLLLNKRLLELQADSEADIVARRVYEDMVKSGQWSPDRSDVPATPDEPKRTITYQLTGLSVQAAQAPMAQAPMVKDIVLSILKEAYPVGLTAAQIKGKAFLKFKTHINPNTLTVTLGRYSRPKDGEPRLARCDGRIWFYVPADGARAPELAFTNGGKHAAE